MWHLLLKKSQSSVHEKELTNARGRLILFYYFNEEFFCSRFYGIFMKKML